MKNYEKIIDMLNNIKVGCNSYDIFNDWISFMTISINNRFNYSQTLEDMYLSIVKQYTRDELLKYGDCMYLLADCFEEKIDDYLGKIYMNLGGNSRTGQFFTPFNICEMMAKIQLSKYDGERIVLNEPSAGGGANVLAAAKAIKDKGYNYQKLLHVVSQDIDRKCSYMQFVQYTLTGISAEVVNGDTLSGQVNFKLYTPSYFLRS